MNIMYKHVYPAVTALSEEGASADASTIVEKRKMGEERGGEERGWYRVGDFCDASACRDSKKL